MFFVYGVKNGAPSAHAEEKVLLSQNMLCAYGDALLSLYTGQKYFHPI